jgi:LacI family transcriptional regulator
LTTVKDVAKRAGVSPATVSNVINQKGNVSPALVESVTRAIEELGYRPNVLARGLRVSRTYTVGLVISDMLNPYFSEIAAGVERVCSRRGYTVLLCTTNDNKSAEAKHVQVLRDRQVDGIIIASTGTGNELIEKLVTDEYPLVLINRRLDGVETDCVVSDNVGGALQAMDYLVSLGHRRIGFVGGARDSLPSRERLEGYLRGLAKAGIPADNEIIRYGYLKYSGGYEAAKDLVRISDRPTAIFAANDMMAIGVMDAVLEAGLRIPEDISLVGFDDTMLSSLKRINLTTVRQSYLELGEIATKMLLDKLSKRTGKRSVRKQVVLCSLVVRGSCTRAETEASGRSDEMGQAE